jgi:hypothetical protein
LTTASILLFVIGGLRSLIGLLAFTALLGVLDDDPNMGLFILAMLLTIATVVAGVLQITGGAGCLKATKRGYQLAIMGSVIGAGARLVDLVVSSALEVSSAGGVLVIALVLIAADILIIVTLTQNKESFTN